MRKILFFALLLVVFLLALVADRNVLQESRTARSTAIPPEVRDDDVLEIILGQPDGGRTQTPSPPGSIDDSAPKGLEPPAPRSDSDSKKSGSGTAKPVPAPPPETDGRPQMKKYYYEVQEGDTLTGIAKKLFDDESKVQQLKEWNELDNPHYIQAGQRLRYYK